MIVARCQSDPDTEVVEGTEEGRDIGIVGEDVQDFSSESYSPAPGIETICVFPKNPSKGEFKFSVYYASLLSLPNFALDKVAVNGLPLLNHVFRCLCSSGSW